MIQVGSYEILNGSYAIQNGGIQISQDWGAIIFSTHKISRNPGELTGGATREQNVEFLQVRSGILKSHSAQCGNLCPLVENGVMGTWPKPLTDKQFLNLQLFPHP